MKYKVGDLVRVRNNLTVRTYYGDEIFADGMNKFRGEIHKITFANDRIYKLDDCGPWNFTDAMLEPVNNSKIVITTDGKETLARLYEGNKVVKSAKAICSDDDEFDFNKGAEIAFDRLIGRQKSDKLEEPEFKIGDIVVKADDYNPGGRTEFYPKKNTVGRIVTAITTDNQCFAVQWERGSTSGNDRWSISAAHLRKVNI